MGLWMGETGGASNSGRNTVTNRFMSAYESSIMKFIVDNNYGVFY